MKYFFTIFIFALSFSSYAQKRNTSNPEEFKIEDQFREVHIPSSAIWMGTNRDIESYRFCKGRLMIYNYWSPLSINDDELLNQLNEIQKIFPDVVIIDFLHPEDIELFSPQEAYDIWKEKVTQRPLVIGVNDKVKSMSFGRNSQGVMISTNRVGVSFLSLNEDKEILFEMLTSWQESYNLNKEKSDRIPSYDINKTKKANLFNFPQAIAADNLLAYLYVSDTGNNRIVCLDDVGTIISIAGSGRKGYRDGNIAQAEFNHPQGIVFDSQNRVLYVADTYNHVIRKVNINDFTVSTFIGTGEEAILLEPQIRKQEKAISFPKDLIINEGFLYVTMMNKGHIYKINLDSGVGEKIAGSSSSISKDGKIGEEGIAYPNSICLKDDKLFFLEPFDSKIRYVDKKSVKTFYTSQDGDSINLNLPSSIHTMGNSLYVADTFNHGIKRIGDEGMVNVTGGSKGFVDGTLSEAQFNGPVDLCTMDGKIYVLDALNGAIRVVNPAKESVSTFEIKGARDFYPRRPITKLESIEEKAYAMKGKNLVAIKLNLPDDEIFIGSEIEVENQTGSMGEVISIDQNNGLIMVAIDLEDFWESTYLSLSFEVGLKNVPNHRRFYSVRTLVKYEETEDKTLMGKAIFQL